MHIGHGRLCVCLSLAAFQHYSMDPDVAYGNGRGVPSSCALWGDLQLVHGFPCYDNIHVRKPIALYTANAYSAKCEMSVSACIRSMASYSCCRDYYYYYLLLLGRITVLHT